MLSISVVYILLYCDMIHSEVNPGFGMAKALSDLTACLLLSDALIKRHPSSSVFTIRWILRQLQIFTHLHNLLLGIAFHDMRLSRIKGLFCELQFLFLAS